MNLLTVFLIVAVLLLVSALRAASRGRSARLRAIESRVDVLVEQLDLGERVQATASVEVRDLAARGQKIEAIKRYRDENPGVGLKAAKEAVEALDGAGSVLSDAAPDADRILRKLDLVLASFDLTPGQGREEALASEVRTLALAGQKIEAIRRLRELRPGLGLAEAKAIVDRIR